MRVGKPWSLGLIILLTCITYRSTAQLCSGSLGDPIINVTFGQGSNPGNPLAAASTGYQFMSSSCPNDGYYTVVNSTSACFGGSWHTINADHTGDAQGYFMLVNASYQPGAFYIDTVKGLCQGTIYELAAWVINVLGPSACSGNGIRPNLSFKVERTDGSLIQSYDSGDIPVQASPQWFKHGFFFSTPVGVNDIVLKIVNNAPGGCGNDLGLDDITFRACGPSTQITIDDQQVNSVSFCEGLARQFALKAILSGGFANPEYLWQRKDPGASVWTDIPASNLDNHTAIFPSNALPGLYQFRAAITESGNMPSLACRIYTQVFRITIDPLPVIVIANNSPVCLGSTISLLASGGSIYNWSGPAGFTANSDAITIPNAQFSNAGDYNVEVITSSGCSKTENATVTVNPVPVASLSITTASICEGQAVALQASGGTDYEWFPTLALSDPFIADPIATPRDTTLYSVVVSNSFGCRDTAQVEINVRPIPVANAGPDKIIFLGESTQLQGGIHTGDMFSWSPPMYIDNVNTLTPVVNPPEDQKYVLNVVSAQGCGTAFDTVSVKVYRELFIPTAFTPNNDGLNDSWMPLGLGALKSYHVRVFNRWGELVFETRNQPVGWNGRFKGIMQPAGVYIYMIITDRFPSPLKGSLLLINR